MAARVAACWLLHFDISRSQSGLRIATTAAPVTASDIERTLAEVQASCCTLQPDVWVNALCSVSATHSPPTGQPKRGREGGTVRAFPVRIV